MFGLFAEKGTYTIPDKWARKWVAERVPPQGRQNLGEILRANSLDSYDEIALLEASAGRSAQDDFLLRRAPEPRIEYALVDFVSEEDVPARSWCAVIGPEIARRRKDAGMTQRELAETTGVEQAAISRIESGKANPTLNTLEALADGVGADLVVKLSNRVAKGS
ncbi:MAG: helix-turn-helix transcriptional regulator [Eggerthellaceae bacterium]|nr:helix-turn-helix transcriptional regulator [Eggerthellaceae bacterium]